MTERERQLKMLRFVEIEAEIAEIQAGRVVEGDPAETEGLLSQEQDEIEYELGQDYIERRDREEY